jgi:phosphohistidine phosphatase
MDLLVLRHAIAEDREAFAESGKDDAQRPLTDYGRRRMRKNVRGLRRVAPAPAVIAASPLRRAQDTARIVADAFGIEKVETVDALSPDRKSRDLLAWLSRQEADSVVAVVGHEPHLGTLITWLVGGRESPNAELKKGGACLLRLGDRPAAGTAVLQWLVTPAQLRAIAD